MAEDKKIDVELVEVPTQHEIGFSVEGKVLSMPELLVLMANKLISLEKKL